MQEVLKCNQRFTTLSPLSIRLVCFLHKLSIICDYYTPNISGANYKNIGDAGDKVKKNQAITMETKVDILNIVGEMKRW